MGTKYFIVFALLAVSIGLSSGFMGFTNDGKSRLHRDPLEVKTRGIDTRAITTEWIEQKVDNFDPENQDVWMMRYMANRDFAQPDGPIFVYVGGEWAISAASLVYGHMVDMGRELNGTLFYTEHRYYGESFPTSDISTENMRYLHVDQALADLAHFITYLKSTDSNLVNSEVILVGASYSATMVTWFRQQYPELAVGSWASSAPLLAKVDFYEYKEVVGQSMRLMGGETCYNAIENAFRETEALFLADDFETLERTFNLCEPLVINNDIDKWWFFDSLTQSFSILVQYHYGNQIEEVCAIIESADSDLEGVAAYIRADWGGCLAMRYDEFIEYYSQTELNSGAALSAGRQWFYQTCAEYGWYQSSNSSEQPFGQFFPAELYLQVCEDLYGSEFTTEFIHSNVDATNNAKLALNPGVTNVFFTHGQLDPWRAMGLQEDYNESSPVVIIPYASHCADLDSISDSDNEVMRAAKERIRELVWEWVGAVTETSF